MAKIAGKIIDKFNGQSLEARVQVLSSGGQFLHPNDAILKVGPGVPFFYTDGTFEVDAPRGITQILVERGTEYRPARLSLNAPVHGTISVDIEMERWTDLGEQGCAGGGDHDRGQHPHPLRPEREEAG
jgi:hypothetical protein